MFPLIFSNYRGSSWWESQQPPHKCSISISGNQLNFPLIVKKKEKKIRLCRKISGVDDGLDGKGKKKRRNVDGDLFRQILVQNQNSDIFHVGILIQACNGTNIHHLANAKELATASSLGDTILLIAALCFHSVFEGIAIGVSKTASDAWKALWTISLHKIFAAIAMAIALLRMIPDRPFLSCAAYAFAFAISSPIGVAIGIIIDQTAQGAVADWIFAISMGIACGVFVYVSINHLLSKGYCPDKRVGFDTPFWRFLAVVLGVGVIAVVMIWDT